MSPRRTRADRNLEDGPPATPPHESADLQPDDRSSFVRTRLASGTALAEGRLRIVRTIGQGNSGILYEARDAERGCHVALKQLRLRGPEAVYALKNEFRALRDVSHPNLIRLHELFAEHDQCFFTMDLVDGDPFDWWVRPDDQFSECRLRPALAQLVAAVSAIHESGKLHRDLKPSNVLVTQDGRVVVLDFGLVADAAAGGIGQTLPESSLYGTPAYMAPELALGSPPSAAIDLYAIGVMLFEALTGKLPFEGDSYSVLFAKQAKAVELPSDLARDVPADLRELCLRLLAREPSLRPPLQALHAALAVPALAAPRSETLKPSGLVGRSEELRQLAAAYDVALGGRLSVVMLAGESGIGKTALCDQFLKRMQAEAHALVLAGRCYERESLPFKAIDPLIDELTRCLRRMTPEAAASLLPRDAAALVQLFPVLGRVHVFDHSPARHVGEPRELQRTAFVALIELLSRLRDRGPLIIHVDDLQWTDADSVAFLRYLFVNSEAPPLLFIGSHRDGSADNRLLQSILEAARSNRACRVTGMHLAPLAAAEAELLARRLLRSDDAAAEQLAKAVALESQGSPFFVGELARFTDTAGARPPERLSLTSLLSARFEPLSPRARSLLEVVALAGCPLPVEIAMAAAHADYAEVDAMLQTRWLRFCAPISARSVECFHDRIRESISAGLTESRGQLHYVSLAAALAASTLSDPELMCRFLEGAGDRVGAAQQAVLAAETAANGFAFEHAANLYARALELGAFDAQQLLALTAKLGLALENAGHGLRAAQAYERASSLCVGAASLDYRRRAAEQLLATGNVIQGGTLLRAVCNELSMDLPLTNHAALLATARTRILLRLRSRQLDRDPPRSATPREAMQLKAARSAVTGLIGCLPLPAYAIAGQYLLQAMQSGDLAHRVRAMGFNAFLRSILDPNDAQAAGLLARIEALVARDGAAELSGFSSLMHGTSAYNWNRFSEARRHLARCLDRLRGCVGVEWEVDAAHVYDQLSAHHAGDHADIARTTPSLIEDAFRRGRLWAGSMLSGYAGTPAWLLADDANGYRVILRAARRQWHEQLEQQQWPDYVLAIGEAYVDVYSGDPGTAWARLDRERHKRAGALFKIAGAGQRWIEVHHGRCAAAALGAPGRPQGDPRALAASLERCRKDLARHPSEAWCGFAMMFEGALAAHAGQPERALSALQRSVAHLEAAGLTLSAAAASRRVGQLLGGDRGRQILAAGDALMQAQSVSNPEAMTELYCPGYRRTAG
jgi:hypothetical protein